MNNNNLGKWMESLKDSRYGRWLKRFWTKHWEIIIAAIAGFIIGSFILPKFFR